ncbi:MAG TPA: protein kinase [Bacteroidota bacterium]|jgi:serine/threonine protein kinase/tetratricopeptide (TPR) repeat protein
MIGKIFAQYKILQKLGEGGMGVVFKAEDTKLDRFVALKFLPEHLTSHEAERARFLQEAKSASALNHPNVCTIYDIREEEGQQFIVMEYVDGVTLRQKIPVQKLPDALGYAIQIAEALHEAHSKGIVHRDIKAENIMINAKNQVKVMDFGLAKLKGSLKLTRTSSTVGTLAYMAPEQIHGGEVDGRSDIFSFGIVLFEMLAGRTPFRGDHEAAMVYSIVNEEPESIEKLRPDLPAALTNLIQRALEKDPADRYQHADDIASELRRIQKQSTRVTRTSIDRPASAPEASHTSVSTSSQPALTPEPAAKRKAIIPIVIGAVLVIGAVAGFLLLRGGSTASKATSQGRMMVAVLPFENLGTPDQEYIADGITEEITSRLSGLSGLGVIARTSVMQYKKTTKTLQQIGSELGVEYVLQGTIRWGTATEGGMRVRVNPALIKLSDATQVWSQPYDAVSTDVLKLQSDIATQVAGALGITLLQPERKSIESRPTENSEAYDAYLRGMAYFRRSYAEQDFRIGLEMFQKAVDLDPKFALAWAKLSENHSAMYWFYFDHTQEGLAKAKAAVDEALRLDPNLPDAHAALGLYYYWGSLDYDNALREFALAAKVRPNDSQLLMSIGSVKRRQGKFEEAAASMTKGMELDPRSSEVIYNAAQTYALMRNYAEAEKLIERSVSITPDLLDRSDYRISLCLLSAGDTKKARSIMRDMSSIPGFESDAGTVWLRTFIEMCDGNYEEGIRVITASPAQANDHQFEFVPKNLVLGELYGLLKQPAKARAEYDSARELIERKVHDRPDDSRLHSALGITYAGLGRKEDAIREGKKGVDLLPVSKEAWRGAYRVRDLARIYAMTGEPDAAMDQLEHLLSIPAEISVPLVRIDPRWAPLRGTPRFQAAVAAR